MTLPVTFLARRAHNARNGHYYSLRVVYPSNRSSEFGRVRMERDGWNAWGDDEDFGKALRAACHRAGRRCDLKTLLVEIRKTYMEWHHEEIT